MYNESSCIWYVLFKFIVISPHFNNEFCSFICMIFSLLLLVCCCCFCWQWQCLWCQCQHWHCRVLLHCQRCRYCGGFVVIALVIVVSSVWVVLVVKVPLSVIDNVLSVIGVCHWCHCCWWYCRLLSML